MNNLDIWIEKVIKLYFKGFSVLEAIEIVKDEIKICDCCNSELDVREFIVAGYSVSLCDECRQKLIEQLENKIIKY